MTIFTEQARTDLLFAVHTVYGSGAAHLPTLLAPELCVAWQRELEMGPFTAICELGTPVQQEFESYTLTPGALPLHPITDQVQAELSEVLRSSRTTPTLADWCPNELAVQRYRPSHWGITPHRDYERDHLIVAVWTVSGTARFNRYNFWNLETPEYSWETSVGSLILLRAPGLTGRNDRPYHSIDAPMSGERISVGMRYNTKRLPSTD